MIARFLAWLLQWATRECSYAAPTTSRPGNTTLALPPTATGPGRPATPPESLPWATGDTFPILLAVTSPAAAYGWYSPPAPTAGMTPATTAAPTGSAGDARAADPNPYEGKTLDDLAEVMFSEEYLRPPVQHNPGYARQAEEASGKTNCDTCRHARKLHSRYGCVEQGCPCTVTYMDLRWP